MSVDGTPGSSRALRLDPFALPVQYAARDSGADGQIRQVELDRDRGVMRRGVRGIRMTVGAPVAAFRRSGDERQPGSCGQPGVGRVSRRSVSATRRQSASEWGGPHST